jgi:hypothetical protein
MAMAKFSLQHTKNQPRTIATLKVFNVKVCANTIAHMIVSICICGNSLGFHLCQLRLALQLPPQIMMGFDAQAFFATQKNASIEL